MRILMLGNSEIGRRRVLPAFAQCGITHVDIASRSSAGAILWPEGMDGIAFDDYATAISHSEADLVWVSTVNALHAQLAKAALDSGRHVVIDKPATTTLGEALLLADLALRRHLVLAEATVYAFHPQIDAARKFFTDVGSAPGQILVAFSFPPLPPGNFRHSPDMGGGALLDLGPYAMSLGRIFLDAVPDEVICRRLDCDSGFNLLATYPGNRSVAGYFGTTTAYVNRLILLGPKVTVTMGRAFTTTPDLVCQLDTTVSNAAAIVEVPAADSFALFISTVLAAVERNEGEALLQAMLDDAKARARLQP